MPPFLGSRYILVNIPAFLLQLIENGTPVLESRVIVGQPERPTPRIMAEASGILLNPSWTIPPTILREDVLPKLRRDPDWLAERNMRVFMGWGPDARELDPALIDWRTVSAERFPYVIRQDPGSANALGRLKVEMPNSAGVYLHDTPDKRLFELTNRAKSSGCVRIDRIMDLAVALLGENWNSDRLASLIGSGATSMLPLPRPVPIYLAYFPAWVDGAGAVHFSPDIYRLDWLLQRALDGKPALAPFGEAMACGSDQDPGLN
jgi:murein L,D-transpeptidase YcbB/YkuD